MRLSRQQVETIKSLFEQTFGSGRVYLFGSRVDDSRRGGDIDLYIVANDRARLAEKKIHFLGALKRAMGEQRIDVVLSHDPNRPIEKKALKEGIPL
jgi:predicted nucleotidyltransferase